MNSDLENLLQKCTVKLSFSFKEGWGTGFWIAPDLIVTCNHVVEAAGSEKKIVVSWNKQENFTEARTIRFFPKPFDLAILELISSTSFAGPCVLLDPEVQSDDDLYTFGYSDDYPEGTPVTMKCEGLTGATPPLIKFKQGQIRPGLSGSPLLNCRTGKVCGVIMSTR